MVAVDELKAVNVGGDADGDGTGDNFKSLFVWTAMEIDCLIGLAVGSCAMCTCSGVLDALGC